MSPKIIYKIICNVNQVDSMKRGLFISLVGILLLISIAQAGICGAAAGNKDSPIYRAGTVPTALVAQASTATVRVGDTVTASGKLTNKNTGAGIPGATLSVQYSLDGSNWITVASVTTDSKGIVSQTGTIPDPRPLGYQLPLTVYGRVIYAGDETYAATAGTYSVTVLPP
jgi:hypothetical protein